MAASAPPLLRTAVVSLSVGQRGARGEFLRTPQHLFGDARYAHAIVHPYGQPALYIADPEGLYLPVLAALDHGDDPGRELYTGNSGSGGKVQLTDNDKDHKVSVFSPNGKKIAYEARDGWDDEEIYSVHIGGGGEFNVTDNNTPTTGLPGVAGSGCSLRAKPAVKAL